MAENLSLLKGTLDVLVLKSLSWGPMNGVEIITWLERRSEGSLAVEDSALYHGLHRMEERGFVSAEWGTSESNRRARYYSITPEGKRWLLAQSTHFLKYAEMVSSVLRARSRLA